MGRHARDRTKRRVARRARERFRRRNQYASESLRDQFRALLADSAKVNGKVEQLDACELDAVADVMARDAPYRMAVGLDGLMQMKGRDE